MREPFAGLLFTEPETRYGFAVGALFDGQLLQIKGDFSPSPGLYSKYPWQFPKASDVWSEFFTCP